MRTSAYAGPGAEVLTTNAYAVVPFHIGDERFAADGSRLAALAGELARSVADEFEGAGWRVACRRRWVRIGRSGSSQTSARRSSQVLVDAQAPFVDVWLAETVSSIAEAELIARGARRCRRHPTAVDRRSRSTTSTPMMPTASARSVATRREPVRSGEPVADAVAAAEAIGCRAGRLQLQPAEVMEAAVRAAAAATDPADRCVRQLVRGRTSRRSQRRRPRRCGPT